MDNDVAIVAEGISKKYKIGAKQLASPTMRDLIADACIAPFKKIKSAIKGEHAVISGLEKTLWALQEISFEVKVGEVLGIVGHNGSGKSTLLKILSKITRPTHGQATLYGRLGSLLEVGTGFHPDLTGRENIFLNGAILGMKRKEIIRQFDEIVAFAEIDQFIDTPVKFYSSGMYIRLAFAVAAHLEPEILIVDEVLAVGDSRFQKKCLGKMENIAKQGRTVLFVSHNLPSVRNFCSKALLLQEGRLIAHGPTDAVLKEYLQSTTSFSAIKTWSPHECPSNGSFRFLSIRLLDTLQQEISSVHLSEDATIEIEYEVVKEGVHVGFSLILFDIDGNCIFSSPNNHEPHYYGKPLKSGIYRSKCCIHGDLLNEGRYTATIVGFCANRSDSITLDRIISFEAVDDGVLKGDFYGKFGGIVRPKLLWKTERKG